MARIRTIKPAFFRSYELYLAEEAANRGRTGPYMNIRMAFAGLITAADREGRFKWRPAELKLDCLPHDPVDFNEVLSVLQKGPHPFIRQYTVKDEIFGDIPGFLAHQRPHPAEAKSSLPSIELQSKCKRTSIDARKGTDNAKGREGKGTELAAAPPATGSPIESKPKTYTPIQQVIRAFKEAKKIDADDAKWDADNFKRFARAARDILKICADNTEVAIMYVLLKGDEYDCKGLEGWGLEAIARAASTDKKISDMLNGGGYGRTDSEMGTDRMVREGRSSVTAAAGSLAGDALRGLVEAHAVRAEEPTALGGPGQNQDDDDADFS